MKREPWQPQCPEAWCGQQCEREEGHEGMHESSAPNDIIWGYTRLYYPEEPLDGSGGRP